jgi:NADH-quinone oxidoreductase subunit C
MADHLLTAADLRARLAADLSGAVIEPDGSPADDAAAADQDKTLPVFVPDTETLIDAARLPDVARYLRDQAGYAFLSDITIVDYLLANVFELVYIFFHPAGGGPLTIKVRVPRDRPEVPALTPIWPGADFMEREGFDLFGIIFVGHPRMQRIYMWDEFEGHPMRRDFPKQGDKYLDED